MGKSNDSFSTDFSTSYPQVLLICETGSQVHMFRRLMGDHWMIRQMGASLSGHRLHAIFLCGKAAELSQNWVDIHLRPRLASGCTDNIFYLDHASFAK
jgi:hypothetical protein